MEPVAVKEAFSAYGPLGGAVAVLTGALVWALYYILSKAHPAMLRTFSEEMEKERTTCERRHQENRESHKETLEGVKEIGERVDMAMKEHRHSLRNVNHALVVMSEKWEWSKPNDPNDKAKGDV